VAAGEGMGRPVGRWGGQLVEALRHYLGASSARPAQSLEAPSARRPRTQADKRPDGARDERAATYWWWWVRSRCVCTVTGEPRPKGRTVSLDRTDRQLAELSVDPWRPTFSLPFLVIITRRGGGGGAWGA